MKNGGGHFAPELGGHFELESGGHFKLELGGQYHWNLHPTAAKANPIFRSTLKNFGLGAFTLLIIFIIKFIKIEQLIRHFRYAPKLCKLNFLKKQKRVEIEDPSRVRKVSSPEQYNLSIPFGHYWPDETK